MHPILILIERRKQIHQFYGKHQPFPYFSYDSAMVSWVSHPYFRSQSSTNEDELYNLPPSLWIEVRILGLYGAKSTPCAKVAVSVRMGWGITACANNS